MRELTLTELDQVGGGDFTDSLKYWGAVAAIGQISFGSSWGTIAALTAFGLSPLAAPTMVGLAFAGGVAYLSN